MFKPRSTASMRKKRIDKYVNAQCVQAQASMRTQYTKQKYKVSIKSLRARKHELYTSRTFVRLIVFECKRIRQS